MFSFSFTYPIGIDIGNSSIYAAQLKENKQGLTVRGLAQRGYQSETHGILESKDTLVPLLRNLVKAKGLRGKRVVVHFPPQYILNFPISFEVGKEESVEAAILRHSRHYLTFPIEEAIIDYPSLTPVSDEERNTFRASIIAARKDQMVEYLSLLKQAGLSVEVVDFGVSSLMRLHSYPHKTIQNPIVLCSIGSCQSLLSVVTQDSILVQRHAPWGVEALLKNLKANLELSNTDKAKLLLKKYGLFYEDCLGCQIDDVAPKEERHPDDMRDMYRAIYQIINPMIEELVHELHKVIGYARSGELDAVIEGIYIYGQGTSVRHLDRYLEKRLNLTARLMNPLNKIALSEQGILSDFSEGGSFGMALGLAMRKVTWP